MIEIVVLKDRRHDAEFTRRDKATEYVRRLVRMGFDLSDLEIQEDDIELDPVEDLGVRMASLRSKLIHLAHAKPELRSVLFPLLREASASFSIGDHVLLPAGHQVGMGRLRADTEATVESEHKDDKGGTFYRVWWKDKGKRRITYVNAHEVQKVAASQRDLSDDLFRKASLLWNGRLQCDMNSNCAEPVTHIDREGYVYCTKHVEQRKSGGASTRKLRPAEIKKLEQGQTIKYAAYPREGKARIRLLLNGFQVFYSQSFSPVGLAVEKMPQQGARTRESLQKFVARLGEGLGIPLSLGDESTYVLLGIEGGSITLNMDAKVVSRKKIFAENIKAAESTVFDRFGYQVEIL